MNDVAIRVENLSKRYRRGLPVGHDRLSEVAANLGRGLLEAARRPWRRQPPEVAGVTARHEDRGDFWALDRVSFEVPRGQVVGIVGRNGAGKSTLLKVLSRITEPTSGRFGVAGRVSSLLEVGTGFHPELTGRENVFLNGSLLGMSGAEVRRRFDAIAAFADIDAFLDTPVKRYSSGMQMRLGFAVAAHLEPDILMVDEVLAVGDAEFQKKCLGKMREVAGEGRTILFVSHNTPALAGLCDSVVWIAQGRVMRTGPANAVLAAYAGSGAGQHSVRRWPAGEGPGNERARLRMASVTPASGETGPITIRTPVRIELEVDHAIAGAPLNLSVHLHEAERGCIFNVGSPSGTYPAGHLRGTFVIPGDFLNDGLYTIRLLVVRDESIVVADMGEVLTFQVHDLQRTANWYGKWAGAVRPTFAWEMTPEPVGS